MTIKELIGMNQDYDVIVDSYVDDIITKTLYEGRLYDIPPELQEKIIIEVSRSEVRQKPVISVDL